MENQVTNRILIMACYPLKDAATAVSIPVDVLKGILHNLILLGCLIKSS